MWRGNSSGEFDRLRLNECPVGYVTAESEQLVLLFVACRALRAPAVAAGLLAWPARLVDALLVLEQEAQRTNG